LPAIATVIIPVHNGATTLADQLRALTRQADAPPFEVAVVLNRCTDASKVVAESFATELQLRIVVADDHPSASYARNAGAAHSACPNLLFCDADDEVGEHWVAAMLRPLEQGVADFVGGCPIVDRVGLPDWAYQRFYRVIDGPHLVPYGSIGFPSSASVGFVRRVFEHVGGFDESFAGAGYEDVEVAYRLFRAGYRVGLAPGATFRYRPRTTLRGILAQRRGYAKGHAHLLAMESSELHALSALQQSREVARTVAKAVVRQRQWNPKVLIADAYERWESLDAVRRLARLEPSRSTAITSSAQDFLVPLSTPVIGGLALQARPEQAGWYAKGGVEQQSLALVEALLREGDTFVDCGANVGTFSLCAAMRVGPGGRVIAFEPDPRTRPLLVENMARHQVSDRVSVRSEALGAEPGRLMFNQYANDVVSGFLESPSVFTPGEVVDRAEIEVIPLDTALVDAVDLVKIDVEGFEIEVLDGAVEVLERSPRASLIIELNPATMRSAGRRPDALIERFAGDRWSLWLADDRAADPEQRLRPLDDDTRSFVDRAPDGWYGNLIVLALEREDDVRALVDGINGRMDRSEHHEALTP
jgi:FkbM family methyltransferase